MAKVTMPDGVAVEMPDQLDPALGARLRAFHDDYALKHAGPLDVVKGVGDAALSGASKVATGIVGSGVGLVNRLVAAVNGGDGQAASDAAHDYVNNKYGYDTQTPVGHEIGRNAEALAGGLGGNLVRAAGDAVQSGADKIGIPHDFTHSQLSEAGDIANVIPVGGGLMRGAAASGDAARMAAQNGAAAATRVIPLTDIDSALEAVGYKRPTSKNPNATGFQKFGTSIVGEDSLPAGQSINAQAISNRLAKHDAGVPAASQLNYATLEKARNDGPAKVYEATRQSLPEQLTQDTQLQNDLKGVGDGASQLPRSPDVDALKQTMLDQPNMNRDQLFANMAEARDRAQSMRVGAHPDRDAMAEAYSGIANAYEDFLERQLRANTSSAVNVDDFTNARTQFAKNYDVQNALQGTDIDASKIGATQRKNPNLLTGGLQLIAEHANRSKLSAKLGQTTLPDTGMGSSGSVSGQTARTVGRFAGGGLGAGAGYLFHGAEGAAAGGGLGAGAGDLAATGLQNVIRRALTGTPESGTAAAEKAITDPRLANFFGPKPPDAPPGPLTLTPPPGAAFTPHQPELSAIGQPKQRDFFGRGIGGMTLADDVMPPAAPLTPDEVMANRTAHVNGALHLDGKPNAPATDTALYDSLVEDLKRSSGGGAKTAPDPRPNLATRSAPFAANPGDVPYANVLAHGVEQPPAAGLSLAPMGLPASGGMPYRVDPTHMAGGLTLTDDVAPTSRPNVADVPELGYQNRSLGRESQIADLLGIRDRPPSSALTTRPGVPEDIVQRVAKGGKVNKRDIVNMNLSDLNAPTLAELLARRGG